MPKNRIPLLKPALFFAVLFIFFSFSPNITHAAARFWVGGGSTANWSAITPTNWSATSNGANNASVPVSTDDVIFDGVGTGASNSTLSGNTTINSLDMTGYANTFTQNAVQLTIVGNKFKLSSGMTYTLVSPTTSALLFTSVSGTEGAPTAITSSGKTLGNVTLNGLGGYFALQDDMLLGTTATSTLTAGTFDANGKNVTVGLFNSTNSNIRTITIGTGAWTITGNNGFVWTTSLATNLTLNRGSPINFNYSGSTGIRNIRHGDNSLSGTEANSPDFSITAGSDIIALTTFIHNLDFTGFSGTLNPDGKRIYGNLTFSSGMTVTLAGITFAGTSGVQTITSNGQILNLAIVFDGVGGTFKFGDNFTMTSNQTPILTNGTLDANGHNFTTGGFQSNNSNIRTITMGTGTWAITGNNGTVWATGITTGLTLNRGNPIIFNYAGSVGTRGIRGATNVAGGAEENDSPDISITAGSDAINMATHFRNVDFTGFSGTLEPNTLHIYGNLIFSPSMTITGNPLFTTFSSTSGTKTITSNGQTLDFPIIFDGIGGTWQLADPLTLASTRALTLNNGTLDVSSSNFPITVGGNWINNGGTFVPRQGIVTLTGLNQQITGSNIFFNLIKSVSSADTLTFGAGDTQTINQGGMLTLNGSSGNLLSLRSSTPGIRWKLSVNGNQNVSSVDVQDSDASGGNTITALNFFNNGNNINWNIPGTGGGTSGGGYLRPPLINLTPTATNNFPAVNSSPVAVNSSTIPECTGTSVFSTATGEPCVGSTKEVTISSNPKPATLGLWSQGNTVMELQKFLNKTLNSGLAVDGILGPKTEAAVKIYQSQNNLVPDGVVGPKTKGVMNGGR